ncbi:MAG: AAA family ATPase [Rhodospirillaceae bacterium]|nr:AAA family ATPase [Rhodospirillaceae bacterium]
MEQQLEAWLEGLGMGRYAPVFLRNDIDLDTLPHLSEDDLKELGLTLGHRRKLQAALRLMADAGEGEPGQGAQRFLRTPPAGVFATERKIATVLFCDICESTQLIADLDAEQAAERLGTVIHIMKEAVRLYGGTVNKIQGDGIMAIFGAPLALEDHAARACYAAAAMRDSLARQMSLGLRVRTGINSGEIVVRGIRNDFTEDYDAVGPAVHIASRMESLAAPGTIRLTRSTRDLAADFIEVRSYGPTPVKGLADPIETFELQQVRGSWSRWDVRAAQLDTPMVGREAEMAALRRAAASARAGVGHVVGVAGHPGMGKSRLVYEQGQVAEQDGWTVWHCGASPVIQHAPYLMVTRLLRNLCEIPDDAGPADVRQSIHRWLDGIDARLLEYLSAFEFLLNQEPEDRAWAEMGGDARRLYAVQAFSSLVFAQAEKGPLLLVLEDLHWADDESIRLVDALVDIVPAASALVLTTYRLDFRPSWQGRSYVTLLRLLPLGKANTERMLENLLGRDDSMIELIALLSERTEGRPLFIEEIIRSLIENGAIAGEPGRYRKVRDIAEIQIPDSVQAVIAARVDRLDPEQKRVLQCAAAVGRRISVELLRDLGGWSDEEYHELLRSLQIAELVFQRNVFPRPELAFKHSLTMEVAYASLPMADRKRLHADLFQLIERGDYYRQEDRLERLAYHALSAELWEPATRYLDQAAARAIATSAHRDAARLLEQAMGALGNLDETPETVRWAIDVRLKLRAAYGALAQLKQTRHQLTEARDLAVQIGDQQRLARVLVHETIHEYLHGDIRRAIETGEQALGLAEQTGERDLILMANLFLGISCRYHGEIHRSIAILMRMLDAVLETRFDRHGAAGTTSVLYLANLAQAEMTLGNFEAAQRHATAARAISEQVDRPFDLAFSDRVLGAGLMLRGRWAESLPHLERGLEAARTAQISIFQAYNACFVSMAYAQLGRLPEARELMEQAEAELREQHFTSYLSFAMAHLTDICRRTGDLRTALGIGNRAVTFARQGGYRGAESVALRSLGSVLLAHDPPVVLPARHFLEHSARLMEQVGMRPHRTVTLRLLARTYTLTGETAAADRLLACADAEIKDMGMVG